MAIIHRATLTPSKLELLESWLPTRPWLPDGNEFERVGGYRFDDPAGEVGIEFLLVRSGDGPILHVPLSYRAAPLAGADGALVGTLEHSVLGTRWVYDGCTDPVVVTALVSAVLTGSTQVVVTVEVDGETQTVPPDVTVRGTGAADQLTGDVGPIVKVDEGPVTTIHTSDAVIEVVRTVGSELTSPQLLLASWTGYDSVALAGVAPAAT